jgi:hypothetical protein
LAHQAFDEQRRLKDGNADQNVRGLGAALVRTAIALGRYTEARALFEAAPELAGNKREHDLLKRCAAGDDSVRL